MAEENAEQSVTAITATEPESAESSAAVPDGKPAEEMIASALEALAKSKDAASLAECCVQLCGGDKDGARALLQSALANVGESSPPGGFANGRILTNGVGHKRPAEDAPEGADASAKVAREGSYGDLGAARAPSPEVVDLNYYRGDAEDEAECSLMLLVPDPSVSTIIGKSGATITQIQNSSETKIDIQTSGEMVPGQHERRVCIKGTIKNANIGAYLVGMKVLEKMQTDRPASELAPVTKLLVPNQSVSFIIGKQGVAINEVQDASGGRIQIEKAAEMLPGLGGRVVTITGGTRSRLMAQYLISRAIAQHALMPSGGGGGGGGGGVGGVTAAGGPAISVDMFVQNNLCARLIGKQGKNISELQEQSGARVQIQKESEMGVGQIERKVTLEGSQASVALCQTLINRQMAEWKAMHGNGPGPGAGSAAAPAPGAVHYPPPASYGGQVLPANAAAAGGRPAAYPAAPGYPAAAAYPGAPAAGQPVYGYQPVAYHPYPQAMPPGTAAAQYGQYGQGAAAAAHMQQAAAHQAAAQQAAAQAQHAAAYQYGNAAAAAQQPSSTASK